MDGEPAFTDRRGDLLVGFWVALGALATGVVWATLAGGTPQFVHPGMLGVVLSPLAALALIVYAVRLLRVRRKA